MIPEHSVVSLEQVWHGSGGVGRSDGKMGGGGGVWEGERGRGGVGGSGSRSIMPWGPGARLARHTCTSILGCSYTLSLSLATAAWQTDRHTGRGREGEGRERERGGGGGEREREGFRFRMWPVIPVCPC